jgi:hypothetical protein
VPDAVLLPWLLQSVETVVSVGDVLKPVRKLSEGTSLCRHDQKVSVRTFLSIARCGIREGFVVSWRHGRHLCGYTNDTPSRSKAAASSSLIPNRSAASASSAEISGFMISGGAAIAICFLAAALGWVN